MVKELLGINIWNVVTYDNSKHVVPIVLHTLYPSASNVTFKNVGKWITWINYVLMISSQ